MAAPCSATIVPALAFLQCRSCLVIVHCVSFVGITDKHSV